MYAKGNNMNKSLGIYNIIDNEGINRSIKNVINSNVNFNTYTSPKGLKELRIEISNFLHRLWNYMIEPSNMLITTGSQQSIKIISDAILKDGDTIIIEEPTYYGALEVFKEKNINLYGVNIKEDGIDLEELEKKIIKYNPKLIYVVPTFNNPTGYSWSNKVRKKFLKIINKYNILVIEDDPYNLINFTNNKYKSLYHLNNGKNIIYLGTFSKVISPSINVGYIISNLNDILYSYKRASDLCTSLFSQYVVLDYLKNNKLEDVIKEKIVTYKQLLKKSIKDLNKDEIEYYTKPKGGLFYLVKLKDNVNTDCIDCNKYYIDNEQKNITRINICAINI